MIKTVPTALIISISSDIGYALAKRWRQQGMDVAGTYRTPSSLVDDLNTAGIKTFHCDIGKVSSVRDACALLRHSFAQWDYLVFCPGTLEPVGAFETGILLSGENPWKSISQDRCSSSMGYCPHATKQQNVLRSYCFLRVAGLIMRR